MSRLGVAIFTARVVVGGGRQRPGRVGKFENLPISTAGDSEKLPRGHRRGRSPDLRAGVFVDRAPFAGLSRQILNLPPGRLPSCIRPKSKRLLWNLICADGCAPDALPSQPSSVMVWSV
ncbi:hypothetical protein HUJ04_008721 [Dendroctonus ponderosae]|nr:hypothetical protein HUJ04_008721 [Dendroctonus ponderosae]